MWLVVIWAVFALAVAWGVFRAAKELIAAWIEKLDGE
jgi:hypothetical protein